MGSGVDSGVGSGVEMSTGDGVKTVHSKNTMASRSSKGGRSVGRGQRDGKMFFVWLIGRWINCLDEWLVGRSVECCVDSLSYTKRSPRNPDTVTDRKTYPR